MVYTVTANPSLDYFLCLDSFQPGKVHRVRSEAIYPGGKGINLAIVLQRLGVPSECWGFYAGFTGRHLVELLQQMGCKESLIPLAQGQTRINVKLCVDSESELNGQGISPDLTAWEQILCYCERLQEGDWLVLAGSLPSSLPVDAYARICRQVAQRKPHIVVDTSGEALLATLAQRPFLVKPNRQELQEIFGMELHSMEEMIQSARRLQQMGACNVLVSLGEEGAVLLDETGRVQIHQPPDGRLVQSVGAGDALLAGFIAKYLECGCYARALRMGLAAGSAAAYSQWLPQREEMQLLYDALQKKADSD